MNYENKYKKAIKFLKELSDSMDNDVLTEELQKQFPELKESEDEKIRKALVKLVKKASEGYENVEDGVSVQDAIAWLEKQGEKGINGKNREIPFADKVEPKFKVGDFIVNDYCMGRIVEITNDAYLLDTEQGIPFSCHSTRLWDIAKDAKAGDVLYCKSSGIEYIVMSKGINEHGNIDSYFRYNSLDGFGIDIPKVLNIRQDDITPATKEQRDQLEKAMTDAGYTFDFEKKELKKIEQKPAWSEEDENRINRLIAYFEDKESFTAEDDVVYANWLKSLKDRVQPQPKQEWGEEDKDKLNRIYSILGQAADTHAFSTTCRLIGDRECIELQDFLKFLRPQNAWKPSDEQMKALWVTFMGGEEQAALASLYNDLKKLK